MLVQLRTGRTGLRHFLSKARVSGYESGQCSCGTGPETPRNVLIHCPHEAERRIVLREALGGHLDLSRLLDTPRGAPVASKWMIRSGRILQFKLAGALVHEDQRVIKETYLSIGSISIGSRVFSPTLLDARFSLKCTIGVPHSELARWCKNIMIIIT